MYRRVLVVILVFAVLASCSKETSTPQQRPAPEVTVMTVTPRDIPRTPSFVAQTESSRQVNIVARVSGFLDRIAYQEGEMVKKGQLLFQLDPKPFKAQLESARGELGFYTISNGTDKPLRVKIRTGSFTACGSVEAVSPGLMIKGVFWNWV